MKVRNQITNQIIDVQLTSDTCVDLDGNCFWKISQLDITNEREFIGWEDKVVVNPQIALSIGQMEELKELGMDISDASFAWRIGNHAYPAYTLEDILLKIPYNPIIDCYGYKLFLDRVWFGTSLGYRNMVNGQVIYKTEYMSILKAAFTVLKWAISELPKIGIKGGIEIKSAVEVIYKNIK